MNGADKLASDLRGISRIAIDAMGFIYHFEANERYLSLTKMIFSKVEQGKIKAVTSLVTVAEIFSNQKIVEDEELAGIYRHVFDTWPNLTIHVPDLTDAMLVGAVRVEHGLRLPDAFQVEAALSFGAEVIVTNDDKFRKIKRPKVLILKDYLS